MILPIFLSCAGHLINKFPEPMDGRPVIAGIGEISERIRTNRRIFDFTIRRGLFSSKGEGVFLYSRPDRARIDLYVGSAELVFQYYRTRDGSTVILPAEGRLIRGREGRITISGIRNLEEMEVRDSELITLMLGICEIDDPYERISEVRAGDGGYLLVIERIGEVAYVPIDPATYLPREYQVYTPGGKEREIEFSSIRDIEGVGRPRSAVYRDHRNDIEIRLSFRNETLNEEIRPELFDLPRGWGGLEEPGQ